MTAAPTTITPADQIAKDLAKPHIWYGPSGTQVTGEAVANHIKAAARLMKQKNWDPQLYAPFSGYHLRDALISTEADGLGDYDTRTVARIVLETLLQHTTGAPRVDYEAWSEHSTRTLDEVVRVCQAAASVAGEHGPRTTTA
ncbi:DUF6197 family protein [Streptomyces sp. AC1-42T]|uniref:DUF6197 family protein n=1 Tax=Streptomyces sp. AC1-42T TaxID=2218665 RepID=UPI000DAE7BEC|nr:hypothetical protein [Streptomyces sp. AC1-42T]PZT71446.1 hypothetical protein DNK55_32550 [Streptomyces sp. AC1-42T]